MKVKKKNTLFQLPKKFALHFKIMFFILQIYVLILILVIITTVNGFLFLIHFSIVKLMRTLEKPIPRLCWICLRVCSVSDCIAFFYKGYLVLFFCSILRETVNTCIIH